MKLPRLMIVLACVMLFAAGAKSADLNKVNQISAAASGSLAVSEANNVANLSYSYVGLPLNNSGLLVLQTLCLGKFTGVVNDTGTQFFQSDAIQFSSASGSSVDVVTVPANYQGTGSCTATLYLLFTVQKDRYSKTLATATFNVVPAQ